MSMFCYQCEQTARGTGCTEKGVCGKDDRTAILQDLLVHVAKGVAQYAHRARRFGARDAAIDRFVLEALFTTVTNVNFDPERLGPLITRGARIREQARRLYEDAARTAGESSEEVTGPVRFELAAELEGMIAQGAGLGIESRRARLGAEVTGLQELILYGLKGAASYADHAEILGVSDPEIWGRFHAFLDYLAGEPTDVAGLTGQALAVGELNLQVMELLDQAHTGTFGHPEPTPVRVTPVAGKCIAISGHDLKDLKALLEQTEGRGINVYTHGEMLPAHGYPELKRHGHLVGNYGGAWQDQRREFDAFPGAILMTTNCIQKPQPTYQERVFTCGLVAWPDVTHISDRDFTPVIEAALAADGFAEDGPEKTITVGFGHHALLGAAEPLLAAIKAGKIRHLFLIGGCDGAKSGRNYYTDLAQQVPDDCLILTLACGKYRFNKLDFGTVAGLPRLLDVGQCNDAFSAIHVAGALAETLGVGINDLPLSMILSWYEQKAVAILLTLLHLGVRRIRLGPSLPAFVEPSVFKVLQEKFDLQPVTTPAEDLRAALGA